MLARTSFLPMLFCLASGSGASARSVWSVSHDWYQTGADQMATVTSLDLETGASTPLVNLTMALNDPSDAVNAVAADYNRGLLYAVTRQTDVWEIDINAGSAKIVFNLAQSALRGNVTTTEPGWDMLVYEPIERKLMGVGPVGQWGAEADSVTVWWIEVGKDVPTAGYSVAHSPYAYHGIANTVLDTTHGDRRLYQIQGMVPGPYPGNPKHLWRWHSTSGDSWSGNSSVITCTQLNDQDLYDQAAFEPQSGKILVFGVRNNTVVLNRVDPTSCDTEIAAEWPDRQYSKLFGMTFDPVTGLLFAKAQWGAGDDTFAYDTFDGRAAKLVHSLFAHSWEDPNGVRHYDVGSKVGNFVAFTQA